MLSKAASFMVFIFSGLWCPVPLFDQPKEMEPVFETTRGANQINAKSTPGYAWFINSRIASISFNARILSDFVKMLLIPMLDLSPKSK